MKFLHLIRKYPSVAVLIIANLVPLIQVLFFDLDVFPLVFLFWFETGVIGLLSIPKVIMYFRQNRLHYVSIFVFMVGSLMLAHLIAIVCLFPMKLSTGEMYLGKLDNLEIVGSGLLHYMHVLWLSILSLSLSHLYSFIYNYIGKEEYKITGDEESENNPMTQTFSRVAGMQVAILLSALLIAWIGESRVAIAVLMVLKVLIDIDRHIHVHKREEVVQQ